MILRTQIEERLGNRWITLLNRSSEPGYLLTVEPLRVYVGKLTDEKNPALDYGDYEAMAADGWAVIE